MKSRAAVAFEARKPLEIVEIDVEPPRAGEVLIKITHTGVCHTDAFTLSGDDPEGLFPQCSGMRVPALSWKWARCNQCTPGDHVIPLYTAECGTCLFCKSGKTNLCVSVRATQGKGLMPDGTTRFSYKGKPLYHYMGCSTFSEYTVVAEVSVAKINPQANPGHVCLMGCGVTTGIGAVHNTAKVRPGIRLPYLVWAVSALLLFRARGRLGPDGSLPSTQIRTSLSWQKPLVRRISLIRRIIASRSSRLSWK